MNQEWSGSETETESNIRQFGSVPFDSDESNRTESQFENSRSNRTESNRVRSRTESNRTELIPSYVESNRIESDCPNSIYYNV